MTQKNNFAILFDCDGVLVDSEPALAEISAEVFRNNNIPAKAEDFTPYIGTGEDTYLGEVMVKYDFEYNPDIKKDVYSLYVQKAKEYIKTFPGCLDLLYELKEKQIKMAVVSSADAIKVEANLEALEFDNFDLIISGSDVKRKKPYPDIYLLAAEKLKADPDNCIVVEDATAGIESGKAAGMTTIGFTSECTREELSAAGADYVVDNYLEMRDLITKLIAAR